MVTNPFIDFFCAVLTFVLFSVPPPPVAKNPGDRDEGGGDGGDSTGIGKGRKVDFLVASLLLLFSSRL